MIAPAALPPVTPQEQIFQEFDDHLRRERGLAPKSIVRHSPVIRRFLCEVRPAGAGDLDKIRQEDVTSYVECHARDWSAASGKAMCWSLRAFLRYLHKTGLNPLPLASCVPSIRRWKLARLPTYLSAAQVRRPSGTPDAWRLEFLYIIRRVFEIGVIELHFPFENLAVGFDEPQGGVEADFRMRPLQ